MIVTPQSKLFMKDTAVQLHRDKMAAAFPSERSTKDVINSILDDYEKLTKYVACYTIFLNQLFCVISNAMSSVL